MAHHFRVESLGDAHFKVVDRQTEEEWILPRHITRYTDGRLGMVINACKEYEIAESMVRKET